MNEVDRRSNQLSPRARSLLTILQYRWQDYPPTIEELRVKLAWSSKSLVHRYVKELERGGCVTVTPGKPRGIYLTQPFML